MITFITGTDTGVGKTVVTAALAAQDRARGRTVAVLKPAQTGVLPGEPGDLDDVLRLAGPVTTRELVRLPDPLAPDTAARVAGVTLPSVGEVRDAIVELAQRHDTVLVEGAGGVLVSLGESYTLLDVASQLTDGPSAEFIVVARAGLGTLNHTALTVQAIQVRGHHVRGVVIGSWPLEPGLAERHNVYDLPRVTGVPLLGSIQEGTGGWEPERFQAAAATWIA